MNGLRLRTVKRIRTVISPTEKHLHGRDSGRRSRLSRESREWRCSTLLKIFPSIKRQLSWSTHSLLYVVLRLPSGQVRTGVGREGRRSGNNIGTINKIRGIMPNSGHLPECRWECRMHGGQIPYPSISAAKV
jgi:hypothetical protein